MNRIRELRKELKINQTVLSTYLGITQATLSYWERGDYEPDNASLIRIAEYFDVSVDYLLGVSNIKKSPSEESEQSDLDKLLESLKEEDTLMFNGEILTDEAAYYFQQAIEAATEHVKRLQEREKEQSNV